MQIGKKKILIDTFLNIIAAALPIACIQLLAFPIVAAKDTVVDYGLMVTIYAALMFLPNIIGNSLGNLRLVKRETYENVKGDFNNILLKYAGINIIVTGIILIYYYKTIWSLRLWISFITAVMTFFNAYLEVDFSIKLQFINRLILRVYLVCGYVLGIVIYCYTNYWEYIFLFGQIGSSIWIVWKTNLYKEPLSKTIYYKETRNDSLQLVGASCASASLDYLDRLMLFPLLGATIVSIYNVAMLIGKMILLVTPPINSIVLSYLSHFKKLKKRTIAKMIAVFIGLSAILYIGCNILSGWILKLLYPQFVAMAMEYVPIATLTVMVSTIAGFTQLLVLRFCKIKWQAYINSFVVVIYLVCSLGLMQLWGLYGFCVGNLISYTIKFLILVIVLFKTYDEGDIGE